MTATPRWVRDHHRQRRNEILALLDYMRMPQRIMLGADIPHDDITHIKPGAIWAIPEPHTTVTSLRNGGRLSFPRKVHA
jgi:hypothetical protein